MFSAGLALIVAVFTAYWPALRAPFEFDDFASIPANATIRTLRPSVALDPPPNTSVAGRPVVNYSFAVNYAINEWLGVDQRADPLGPNKTLGYHVANILIHVLCGFLLFALITRTLEHGRFADRWGESAPWIAGAVAALWLLHPIQTEAVDYVVQRTETLVSLCYLATLYASLRAWDARSPRSAAAWMVFGVLACLAGMGSKEVMLTAPLAVILYDRAFHVESWPGLLRQRARVGFYAALVATSALAIAMIAGNSRFDTVGFGLGIPWYEYLYTQAWAIPHYLRLVLWPDHLTLDYGQRPISGWQGVPGAIVMALLFVATIAAWTRPNHWAWFGFLGATFFLLLAPSSSVVPIATEVAAERRIYLALAPALVALVVGVELLRRRYAAPGRIIRPLVFAAAATLALVTFQRSRLYADPQALWRDAVANAPANPRAYDNLASTLFFVDPPRLDEAEALYSRAIALDSTYLHAWPGLASVAMDRGKFDTAEWILEHVLTIDPNYSDAIDHLGRLLLREGKPDRALPYLARFADAYPSDNSLVSLGTAYLQLGKLDSATSTLRAALDLNPNRADALRFLGGLFAEQGRGGDAVPLLERAVALEPESGLDRGLLSLAYAEAGRADDAAHAAHEAVSVSKDASVPILAARAMLALHRDDDARAFFNSALQLDPKNREAAARLQSMERKP